MTDDEIIDGILRREGGFVHDSFDRGGATNYGITMKILGRARGRPATVADVQNLTESEARWIYDELFIREPGFKRILNGPLRELTVDCGVHHGTVRAAKWLQEILGVSADGIIGPKTMAALAAADPGRVYRRMIRRRLQFFAAIVKRDPTQARFLLGWMNRTSEFIDKVA